MSIDGMGTPASIEMHLTKIKDTWQLPPVLGIEVVQVHYAKPRQHIAGGRVSEYGETVEVTIQTDGPIPIRALAPTLHIGDVILTESEPTGPNLTRFIAFEIDRLQDGALIALGWSATGYTPQSTRFRFKIDRAETR